MGNRTSAFQSLENALSRDEDKPRACREHWMQLLNSNTHHHSSNSYEILSESLILLCFVCFSHVLCAIQAAAKFSPLTASRCNFSRFDDCGHFVNFMWIAIATNDDVTRDGDADGDGDGDGDRNLKLFAFCINFNMLHTIVS
uniref:Uncharacterized protein n=1 Tax=Glossina austeni TaxID=7395 RepID=A0A1A9VXQ5_GLOAU